MDKNIQFDDMQKIIDIFGQFDKNVNIIQKELDVNIVNREDTIKISGDEKNVETAVKVIKSLEKILSTEPELTEQMINYTISMTKTGVDQSTLYNGDVICITSKGRPIKSKTLGQKQYIESIKKNTITFGIGPAGTGKTYLAVAMAVKAFKNKEVSRIILTRPAVEAGEKLGFLPGDLQNKVDPYLRPLYDALYDMFGFETYQKHFEKGAIEIAPLAYMRGRTLDDSFIILDEAQNTTPEQMKMFLTRIGMNSRAIVTGDITQIDLPDGKKSGLKDAEKILKNIEDIGICHLTEKDVVRHALVQKIIKAYEKYENMRASKSKSRGDNK